MDIFVSYGHADERWVKEGEKRELIPWLSRQLRLENVSIWADPILSENPSRKFREVIEKEIDKAQIAILLISEDFTNSEFITTIEIPRIRRRVERGEMLLVAIQVGPVTRHGRKRIPWIYERQVLPSETKPLIEYARDDAEFENVRVQILEAIRNTLEDIHHQHPLVVTAPEVGNIPEGHPLSGETPPPIEPVPKTLSPSSQRVRRLTWPVVALFVVVVIALVTIAGAVYFHRSMPSDTTAVTVDKVVPPTPPVISESVVAPVVPPVAPPAPPPAQAPAAPADKGEPIQVEWKASDKEGVLTLPGDVTMEFVPIPAGTFIMGSPADEKDRSIGETQHRVTLSRGFWLGKYEVTQAQWEAVMGNNPSKFKGDGLLPVETVSWEDCQAFIRKLNSRGENAFCLPTEAEWEYACRAGTATRFYWGNDPNASQINDYAWYRGSSGNSVNNSHRTHPVGGKAPNTWGLYDMSGNVSEWCQDYYSPYPVGAVTDPSGPSSGSDRVFRGGGWGDFPHICRSAFRGTSAPVHWFGFLGFRLASSYIEAAESSVVTTVSSEPEEVAALPETDSEALPDEKEASLAVSWEESSEEATLTLPGGVKMPFIKIPNDTSMMSNKEGGQEREKPEDPQSQVTHSQDFWLGKYEVTQAQWIAVMGNNPSKFKGETLPVDSVTWDDCTLFYEKLNANGQGGFCLPTEEQWKFASRENKSNKATQLDEYAWYKYNSEGRTHPVGEKMPNALGLHDMFGNVEEWCADKRHTTDPKLGTVLFRAVKGGSWRSEAQFCTNSGLKTQNPSYADESNGFRLCWTSEKKQMVISEDSTGEMEGEKTLLENTDSVSHIDTRPVDATWDASTREGTLTLPGDMEMEFVKILPGEFIMGSPENEKDRDDDELQHEVKLAHGFWLGKYEVTQAQWDSVMDTNPSKFKGADLPVESLMWDDAQAFIGKLNELGQGTFLLPSEMQWEYACRAGSTTAYCFGNDASQLTHYAWYSENSEKITHPIGKKKPNVWGLYDMHGNIKEWCVVGNGADRIYDVTDQNGKTYGVQALLRGGSIISTPKYCRSACRWGLPPRTRWLGDCGIRIVRNLSVNE